ncbi:hypothetical protein [Chryseobacterium pennipullorum]|uniref:Uncharacterized protein n=1 Tax=Chryseobacterium pennipullorum TaxID=2258963 RepID=A0A3D9B0G6_9FLAO|nr:hypothetical protein [Chryseobacterium pennipullorum]REC46979.1 hypothetical protein DRF67_12205 [Chryseobacterium pennipullorum]
MKNLVLCVFLLYTLLSCKKSETQYINQDNKKETVNDKASNTIHTLPETADTMRMSNDSATVKN